MTSSGVETAIRFLDLAGTVYPFRLTDDCSNQGLYGYTNIVDQVPSLLRLACRRIVRCTKLTKLALQCIPKTLTQPLLEAAFIGKNDDTADLIVSQWPYTVLRLSDVLPEGVFPDVSYASYHSTQLERLCEALSYTTGFVSGFVHYLKRTRDGPGRLKCLDITGFPTAEVVAIYLFSHCVIAINEHRQHLLWQRMLELKLERLKLDPDSVLTLEDEDSKVDRQLQRCSFRKGQGYVARLDLRIDSETMLEQLIPCFNDTDDGGGAAKFRISIGNLFVTGISDIGVMRILRTVQLHELTGLCFAFTRLGQWPISQLLFLLNLVGQCTNLTSLDLRSCRLDLGSKRGRTLIALTSRLKTILIKLIHLRRLSLSVNKITGKLADIIPSSLRLTHFSLDSCRLTPADIEFLASIDFNRQNLVYLDLSHLRVNTTPQIVNSLKSVFSDVMWPRLSVLKVSSSRFDLHAIVTLSSALLLHEEKKERILSDTAYNRQQLKLYYPDYEYDESAEVEFGHGLTYLDITEESAKLNSTALIESFKCLFRIKGLRYLKLEYPHDCLAVANVDGFLDFSRKSHFDTCTFSMKQKYQSKVKLVYDENYMEIDL